ncbi:histone acetyltransferase HPA2-like protein [Corynebacterium suranareeae]|uniref:Mycothiol acetyltransferase n=1 Tax=Corynebacterium suranareeae TaxID=2506452 RepID=A0A160PVV6_9CORY|nr:mycothiol synthase [Corynebacterium suranareeae]BAU96920.1 histone acetyltransferase HPA2-like protein [Corynebacterium suranareeae]
MTTPDRIKSTQIALDRDLREQAILLLKEVRAVDGVDALSEQFVRGLAEPGLGHSHLIVTLNEKIVGLAATDDETTELAVHPAHRRQGIGKALIDATPTSSIWAHGNTQAAQALASTLRMKKTRELLVMAIEGPALEESAVYKDPEGITHSSLANAPMEKSAAEAKWLQANNEAFDWHPEQGGWNTHRLAQAQKADWYQDSDVLFLWDGEEIVGFHWVKQHSVELQEIYVVGLASAYRGRGLGDPLMRLGLHHMRGQGARKVILYVEADNAPAVAAYEKLGFTVAERHVVYEK